MSQNAEANKDSDSFEVLLPRARPIANSKFQLRNLSIEQIVKLVADFQPGVAQSGNVLASAFGPLADIFLNQVSALEDKGENLIKTWNDFVVKEISKHYHELILACGDDVPDEILHYPLFAKRRVVELIRVKSNLLFLQMIVVKPLSFYTVSQLWDPNTETTNVIRDYYSSLARAYLYLHSKEHTAESYFKFLALVRSPYRDLYDLSDEYEAEYHSEGFRAVYLKQLAAARTSAALKLRADQLEGFEHRSFYMPPPVTITAVSSLTLRWLSDQANIFKNNLPATLLEFILEQDPDAYKTLVHNLGKTLSKGILKGIEIGLEPEFPEFSQEELCFKELAKATDFSSPIRRELLANTLLLYTRSYQDKINDGQRLSKGMSYLQGRKLYRPWEIKALNLEIRYLQRDFYQIDLELREISRRKIYLEQVVSEVAEEFPELEINSVLKQADQICKTTNLDRIFQKPALTDPLLLSGLFSFVSKKSQATILADQLEKKSYLEVKLDYPDEKDLVDNLHIWREIVSGKNLKVLKREFSDYRVNRVIVEYERRVNHKSFDEIKKLKPKLSTVVSLVEARDSLDDLFLELAEVLVKNANSLFEKTNKSVDAVESFQNYAEAVAIIWDWITLQLPNPYQVATTKFQQFRPWFEKELSQFVKDLDYDCYIALCYRRSYSVLGLEPGADFNWQDGESFQHFVSILTIKFLNLSEKYSRNEILSVIARFKAELSSPFGGFLNSKRYDLDYASEKILLLDSSQKFLFSSQYRRDCLNFWVDFHDQAFFGNHPFEGLFFELMMKELKTKYPSQHLKIALELLEFERSQLVKEVSAHFLPQEQVSQAYQHLTFLEGIRNHLTQRM